MRRVAFTHSAYYEVGQEAHFLIQLCSVFSSAHPHGVGSAREVHHGSIGALAPGTWRGRPVLYKEGLLHSEGEDVSTTCKVEIALIGHDSD